MNKNKKKMEFKKKEIKEKDREIRQILKMFLFFLKITAKILLTRIKRINKDIIRIDLQKNVFLFYIILYMI